MDCYTRWLKAFPLPDITAESLTRPTLQLDILLWWTIDHHD